MRTMWVASAIVAASIAAGAVVFLTRTWSSHGVAEADDASVPAVAPSPAQNVLAPGACAAAPNPAVAKATLNERYRWARTLMDQRLFDAALPGFRDVATLDPGFPGINLQISQALSGLNRAPEAKTANDAQIAISDCLSKLPPDALEAYCRSELSTGPGRSCAQQLREIQEAAQVQSAVLHLQMAQPPQRVDTAQLTPSPLRIPAAARAKIETKKLSSGRPGAAKNLPDKSLMNGDGTDSALGAYSKP